MGSAPNETLIEGRLQVGTKRSYVGWCWTPDDPSRRLVIEILCDGEVALELRADQFNADPASRHIGDGRHGFTFTSSDLPPISCQVVEVREKNSRYMFGRHIVDPSFPDLADEVARAENALVRLTDEAAIISTKIEGLERLVARRSSRSFGPSLFFAVPQLSVVVVVPSGCWQRLAAELGEVDFSISIEFLIVTDHQELLIGADFQGSPRCTIFSRGKGEPMAKAIHRAARASRAARLSVCDASMLSARGVEDLLQTEQPLLVGPAVALTAQSAGFPVRRAGRSIHRSGLRLLAPRKAIFVAGGYNPEFDGDDRAADVDLATRLFPAGDAIPYLDEPWFDLG
jgi:hypothetical protein